jgi:GT2 family glycosyltransferase
MVMSKDILVVIPTPYSKGSKEYEKAAAYRFQRDLKEDSTCNIHIVYDNKQGLSAVYNTFLKDEYRNKFIVFCHDDVEVHDLYFADKVRKGLQKYNIIGLAGCKSISDKSKPPAWHLISDRREYVGEVAHTDGKSIWTTRFGSTDSSALLVDGLFIGIDVDVILDKNITFDEDYKFHHYDMSFCLRAHAAKATIGVIQLFCIHQGLGDSMHSQEWLNSARHFSKKYF